MLLIVLIGIIVIMPPIPAQAHPLGNFTINQYSRLEPGGTLLRLRYVVDMAEVPAYQTIQVIDTNADRQVSEAEQTAYLDREAPALLSGIQLTLNGVATSLDVISQTISFPPGQGNLPTLRMVLDLAAPLPAAPVQVDYRVTNFERNLGWREILVRPAAGVRMQELDLPTTDVSDELRAYPPELLATPLDIRSLTLTLTDLGSQPGMVPAAPQPESAPAAEDAVTRLIALPELSPMAMLLALLLAAGFGAGHALTPGHGKTLVAAYMVGTRGTWRHALVLGLATTIAHTAGVFLLGFVTLFLAAYILPEQIYPWLELSSGLLVVGIGLALLLARIHALRRPSQAVHDHHHHDHTHDHHHDHAHEHHDHDHGFGAHRHELPGDDGRPVTWRSLIALGISGGLIPCPSALVILLSAIALNRVAFGLALILAFSVGMAAVLTGIGLLLVSARRLFERMPTEHRLLQVLPVLSAALITGIGCFLSVSAVLTLTS